MSVLLASDILFSNDVRLGRTLANFVKEWISYMSLNNDNSFSQSEHSQDGKCCSKITVKIQG